MLQTLMCYAKVHIKNKIIRLNFIFENSLLGKKFNVKYMYWLKFTITFIDIILLNYYQILLGLYTLFI
jgi:hypothetical protein